MSTRTLGIARPRGRGGASGRQRLAVERRLRAALGDLEADPPPGALWIELDGEAVGSLPARFELLLAAPTLTGPAC